MNPNKWVNEKSYQFYKFKFERGELACISKEAMKHIFGSYWEINDENAVALSFSCTNVIENYHSDILEKLPAVDFIIGYIGRINKPFVPNIVKGVKDFANKHPDKSILFVMFGGPIKKIKEIKSYSKALNVQLFVTDYMFPLPLQDLKMCDIFIAGSGSSAVATKTGVPTILIDMYSHEPIGFRVDAMQKEVVPCRKGNHIVDYLEQVLIVKEFPEMRPYDFVYEESAIKRNLAKHVDFLQKSSRESNYYSIESIPVMGMTRWVKKALYHFLPPSWVYEMEKKQYVR